jgi:hypothetical protein
MPNPISVSSIWFYVVSLFEKSEVREKSVRAGKAFLSVFSTLKIPHNGRDTKKLRLHDEEYR